MSCRVCSAYICGLHRQVSARTLTQQAVALPKRARCHWLSSWLTGCPHGLYMCRDRSSQSWSPGCIKAAHLPQGCVARLHAQVAALAKPPALKGVLRGFKVPFLVVMLLVAHLCKDRSSQSWS